MQKRRLAALGLLIFAMIFFLIWFFAGEVSAPRVLTVPAIGTVTKQVPPRPERVRPVEPVIAAVTTVPASSATTAPPPVISTFVLKDLIDASVIAGAQLKLAVPERKPNPRAQSTSVPVSPTLISDAQGKISVPDYRGQKFEALNPEQLIICAATRDRNTNDYELWGYRPVVIEGTVSFETPGSGSFDQVKVEFLPSPGKMNNSPNEGLGSAQWARQNGAVFPSSGVDSGGHFRLAAPVIGEVTVVAICAGHYAARVRTNVKETTVVSLILRKAESSTVTVRDDRGNPIPNATLRPYSSWRPNWEDFSMDDQMAFSQILKTGHTAWVNNARRTAGVDSVEAAGKGKSGPSGEFSITWSMAGVHHFVVSADGLPTRIFKDGEPIVMKPADSFPSHFVLHFPGKESLAGAKIQNLTWIVDEGFSPVVVSHGANLRIDEKSAIPASIVVKGQLYGIYLKDPSDGDILAGRVTFGDDEHVTISVPGDPLSAK